MKKFELNVVNFDNKDVIATSTEVELFLDFHNTIGAGDHYYLTIDEVDAKPGKYVIDGTEYWVGKNGTIEHGCTDKFRDAELNTISENPGIEGQYLLKDDGKLVKID